MTTEVHATSQKMLCKEDGLQEANSRANAEARHRTGNLISSDDDHWYGVKVQRMH